MNRPDDFGLDLATRIALHEMLLQKLYGQWFQNNPNAEERLATLERSLLESFTPQNLAPAGTSDEQTNAWVKAQGEYGQALAQRFVEKIRVSLA